MPEFTLQTTPQIECFLTLSVSDYTLLTRNLIIWGANIGWRYITGLTIACTILILTGLNLIVIFTENYVILKRLDSGLDVFKVFKILVAYTAYVLRCLWLEDLI